MGTRPKIALDERDTATLQERQAALDGRDGPRVGDYVVFADGTERRISHEWPDGYQTSGGGSFYLGHGYMSFSGSLWPGVPADTLSEAGEREADAWFFHHDRHVAHNGITVPVRVRVYSCSLPANH